jgi:hypothetical protein
MELFGLSLPLAGMPNAQLSATVIALAAALAFGACASPPSPTPAATPSPSPSAAPATPTPTPSASAQGTLIGACLQQVNEPAGAFTSYVEASLNWDGPPPRQLLLLIEGTNDDAAMPLTLNGPVWQAQLGMRDVGPKTIRSLIVVYSDGSGADITGALEDLIGGGVFELREGATDAFGTCDV